MIEFARSGGLRVWTRIRLYGFVIALSGLGLTGSSLHANPINLKNTNKSETKSNDSTSSVLSPPRLKSIEGLHVKKTDSQGLTKPSDKMPLPVSPVLSASTSSNSIPELPQALSQPPPLKNATLTVSTGTMSRADLNLYQDIFRRVDQGDFEGANLLLSSLHDQSLVGYVLYYELFHYSYTADYEELTAWLNQYGDLPMAMKVWNLAKRKKPQTSPDPAFPIIMNQSPEGLALTEGPPLTDEPVTQTAPVSGRALTPKSARSAYNDGHMEQAIQLGQKIGDRWVAGLAAWRLKRYDQALDLFTYVAHDPSQNAWVQSAGAFWAGRSLIKLGQADAARQFFEQAATYPFTFYGIVAERRLGVEPAVSLSRKGRPPTYSPMQKLNAVMDTNLDWAASDPAALRVRALVDLNRKGDAKLEILSAMQRATDTSQRNRWLALGLHYAINMNATKAADVRFDSQSYIMPNYKPAGGYSLSKSLIFALARKESKFRPEVKSFSGAYGLLQLMPSTAAIVTGDSNYAGHPERLLNPNTNITVGQTYIHRLLDTGIVGGDLLRAVAAYNGGPRPVLETNKALGDDRDSLLFMESIPIAQTRAYVEEVAASYWIYQGLMGHDSPSIDAAASDVPLIRLDLDRIEPTVKTVPKTAEPKDEE